MYRWLMAPALAVTVGLFTACNNEGPYEDAGVYENEGVGAGDAVGAGYGAGYDYGVIDREVGLFLNEYYDDYSMFEDDELGFETREGVVTVTGEVDSLAERDALVGWINAVPGVQRVEVGGLRVAQE